MELCSQFPNLSDVSINARASFEDHIFSFEATDVAMDGLIRFFLSSLCRRSATLAPIRGLSFYRINCKWDCTLTSSPQLVVVLRDVERLGLYFNEFHDFEYLDPLGLRSSRDNPGFDDPHRWSKHLPTAWLSHNSNCLTHLTLSFRDYAGFYPKIDLRGVFFQRLQMLRFDGFQFTHDWQRDWIISHGKTLKEVFIVRCAMLVERNSKVPLDAEGYPIYGSPAPTRTSSTWPARWHEWFHAFNQSLVRLTEFVTERRCLHANDDYSYGGAFGIQFGLKCSRYCTYVDGVTRASAETNQLETDLAGYDGGALTSIMRKIGREDRVKFLVEQHSNQAGFWETFNDDLHKQELSLHPSTKTSDSRSLADTADLYWGKMPRLPLGPLAAGCLRGQRQQGSHSPGQDTDTMSENSDFSDIGHSCYVVDEQPNLLGNGWIVDDESTPG